MGWSSKPLSLLTYVFITRRDFISRETPQGDIRSPVPGSVIVQDVTEGRCKVLQLRRAAGVPASIEQSSSVAVLRVTVVGGGQLLSGTGGFQTLGGF